MREELWCLYVLKVFHERERNVPEKFLRVILSCLMGEEIERTEFRNLIIKLLERGFISREEGNIYLTPMGCSVVESLEDEISKVDREFIEDVTRRYVSFNKKEREEFLENLRQSVKEGKFTLGKRITKISEEELKNYITNSVLLSVESVQDKFYKVICKWAFLKSLTRENKYRIAAKLKHQLKNKTVENCLIIPRDENLIVISPQPINEITIDNTPLEIVKIEKVPSKEYIYQFLSNELLPEFLKTKGFTSISNNRYIDYNNPEVMLTEIGALKRYSGFRIKIDRITDNKYLLWIDPIFRNIFSLMDFIKYLKASGKTDEEIKNELKEEIKVTRVLPYDSLGEICEINIKERNIKTEKVENLDKSFYDFWKERHNIVLEEEQSLVTIKFNDSLFKYPGQVVYIDRKILEEKFFHVLKEIPVGALNPPERYSKTLEFMDKLGGTIEKSFISIKIEPSLLSVNRLLEYKYFKEVCYLSPPLLKFNKKRQKNEQITDPRAVFKYGPYSQEKKIIIHSVIYPMHIPRSEIEHFISELCAAFQRHNFGKLSFDYRSYFTVSGELKEYRIENVVRQTPKAFENRLNIAIVILPRKLASQKFRLIFKEKFAKLRGIPTQIIFEDTLNKIRHGEYGVIKNLVIQIYSKVLKEREAVWVLEKPADEKEETMYVGLGFSQKPLEGKRANSFAALCDARGLQLKWRAIGVPFEGRYITQKWFEGLLKFLKENIEEKIRRVVIYRKGDTYDSEIRTMMSCLSKSEFWSNYDVDFISVKNDMRRLYLRGENETITNPPLGVFIVLNNKEALCYGSLHQSMELKQGTIIPIRLRIEIGRTPVKNTIKEYYDLCYLNWSAPITISKYPFILNIASKIAEMVKELPDEVIFRWLPL